MSASDTVVSVTSPVLVALSVYTIVSPTFGDALSTDFSSNSPGDKTKINASSELGVGSSGEEVLYVAIFVMKSPSLPVRGVTI